MRTRKLGWFGRLGMRSAQDPSFWNFPALLRLRESWSPGRSILFNDILAKWHSGYCCLWDQGSKSLPWICVWSLNVPPISLEVFFRNSDFPPKVQKHAEVNWRVQSAFRCECALRPYIGQVTTEIILSYLLEQCLFWKKNQKSQTLCFSHVVLCDP